MNGGHLGFMFTAKDLASGTFAQQNKNVKALAANSDAAAAVYERSMARMKKGAIMLGIAIVGLAAMTKVTKAFGEFQYTLASAGAVMHATADEMKVLERAAIDAGIATQFSPKEAAEGLQALGAAGLSVKQSVEVLNPVLDLAAASMGQLGVAGAAENVVGVLNAFSMQADKAGMVADKLTRISQLTNFQFRDFGVAISQAAAQASTADQSFESMLATLGMLRNTNLAASAAATAYREAVRRLSGDKRAQKELTKLHVEVLNKETGKIRDLGAIMAELAPKLEGMNSKQKNLIATQIFGVRGMKTYAAFVSQYHKLVKEGTIMTGDYAGAHARLVSELQNSEGAAKKNRDALLNTAEGQRKLLKGSWETTQIMLGKLALPAVLPALKAFTDILNVVIKLIDMIPAPLRSMMANFVGVGLAIKGVVGAFKMMQGMAGIAMIGRMATGAADVATSTAAAAQNTSRLAQATGKLRAGFSSMAGAVGRSLPFIGVGIAALTALFSYMRAKEAEEMKRQQDIRKNNKLTLDSYVAAKQMADKLRAATARSAETELEAAKKNYSAALRLVAKYAAKQAEVAERMKTARQKMLLAQREHGATSKEFRKAREEYIRLGGTQKAINRAVIASEAEAAKTQLRRAKTFEDKQVYATRIVADRYQKQQAMESQFRKREKAALAGIESASGRDRRVRERAWAHEKRRGLAVITGYQAETAALAMKYRLGEKTELQDKRRARGAIRALALPRIRGLAGTAPSEEFMSKYGAWDNMLRQGRLPRMSPGMLPAFRRYLKQRGGELGLGENEISRLQGEASVSARAATAAGQTTFGGEQPPTPAATGPRRFKGQGAERGIWERTTGSWTDLGEEIARRMREAQQQPGTTIVNLNIDSEKVATKVINSQNRSSRQQDGTGTEGTTVQGNG